jgi:antitoxin HicB
MSDETMIQVGSYPARFEPDEGGRVFVTFPDFPEAATDGADEAEALAMASDCLSEVLAQRLKRGEPIPASRAARRGEVMVAPDPEVAMKLALAEAVRGVRAPAATLARRLKIDHKEARRLLDPTHPSKAKRLADALAVFGYQTATVVYRPLPRKGRAA